MKSLRLLALATFGLACTTSAFWACDAPKTAKADKASSSTAANAVVASTNGQVPVVSAEGGCSAHAMSGAQCTGATKAACEKNASVAAAMGCSGKGASATTASNGGKCGFHGSATTATVAGLRCTEHQNGVAHECNACEDWMQLDKDAHAIGARSQVVALKNGAMIVYTADTPAQVKQLQAMVAKRSERITAAFAGSSDAKLCDECKQLR